MLLDRIQPDRLFPIRLDASPSRAGSAGPLADLKSADFSDLAYIGEGFAKSERYIEFQDRVRRLANDVAAAIERTETSQLA